MPSLNVIAAPAIAQSKTQAPVPVNLSLLAGILGLVGLVAGAIIAFRRRARWAVAVLVLGLVLGTGSIVSGAEQVGARSEAQMETVDGPVSQVEAGRRLFIAKGCMVCHSHAETNAIREFGVDIGPNLTNIVAHPEYLRRWLKYPASIKPETQMPALGLSEPEIEALIAFINAD